MYMPVTNTMVTVQLHILTQSVTLVVSLVNCLYFGYIYKYSKKAHLLKWEVIWVACVETLNYSVQIATGSQRVELGDGRFFPWSRYVGWQLTCPVLLSFIVTSVLRKTKVRTTVQLLMLLQSILLSGMTASLLDNIHWKIVFVCCAFVGFTAMTYIIFVNRPNEIKSANNKSTHLLTYFLVSWTCFPLMFILGPEMSNAISFEYTLVGYAIGDIFAKNLFSIFSWKYLLYIDKKTTKHHGTQTIDSNNVNTPRRSPRKAWGEDVEAGQSKTKKSKANLHSTPELSVKTEAQTSDEELSEQEDGAQPMSSERLIKLETKFAQLMSERQRYMQGGQSSNVSSLGPLSIK